jgi:hypothetical protein
MQCRPSKERDFGLASEASYELNTDSHCVTDCQSQEQGTKGQERGKEREKLVQSHLNTQNTPSALDTHTNKQKCLHSTARSRLSICIYTTSYLDISSHLKASNGTLSLPACLDWAISSETR